MPKISDEKRAARRAQILDAAWRCFQREGLHATTMDDIIRSSGLSAGAVYGYFPSKDELILAALTTSLSGLRALLAPVLTLQPPSPPEEIIRDITAAIVKFSARNGFDLKRIALLGWSESQRNQRLRATMRDFYLAFRSQLAEVANDWRRSGAVAATTEAEDVAKTLLALILGFVVQASIMEDVEPTSMGAGLRGLTNAGADEAAPIAEGRSRA
jgi:AcrR family transcriptional regulator